MSLNGHADVFGIWWDRRNADLRFVLNAWQYDKYMSLAHFYRPVAWKAGGWTFAVYSHYNRGHFYSAHPNVFVTYKGGNNHRHDRFYADRHVTKPAPAVNHSTPKVHHDNKPAVRNDKGHGAPNRQLAHNTSRGNGGGGHFGGRR